jgi:hypothetical protein
MPTFYQSVPNARPAPISDRVLAQLTHVAHDAPKSLASEAECEWLLSAVGPLLEELAKRRAFMAGIRLPLPTANVVAIVGGRS